ncbi:iron uptake system protein EfeO [Arsenicicoccus sp. oral taxon 190]|uniref:iron uptake system protein EfeO n=1 Tax=Arsenicicoccus sp. oral taxon 190 TaxID=1658671 RepID=UPI00067A20E0|nr:iron uptake system protein EfeO [Arsenicicoccus sp. oral taxon 190]AKT50516.1 PbrT family lead (Pb2+) uptake porter [Arsenicicoccus sp. oral taxon 190]
MTRLATSGALLAVAALALTACTDNAPASGGGTQAAAAKGALTVSSTDTECQVSAAEAPSGTVKFSVTNNGSTVTEFYLLGQDGLRIVAEVENIGPGLSRDLVTKVAPGSYFTACKPGMVGDGIRKAFTVTDSGVGLEAQGADKELVDTANRQYSSYVKDQTEQLLAGTRKFAAAYKAGDVATAKALYAPTRAHWERIEPVAESFGDLDPMMDAREADLEPGQQWTGWHVAEKDLWPPKTGHTALTAARRAEIADKLVKDTETLHARTRTMTFTADQIGNGAKSLLEEVAKGKVTGEEEIWSHTDLWDFQANVDGARVAWEGLRPLLKRKDPGLDAQLQLRFGALQKLLDQHRSGAGFVTYDTLSKEEVKALSDAVNALSEPLSRLTAAVV